MGGSGRRVGSLTAGAVALAILAPSYAAPRERPELAVLPSLVLWAWERPVDLRQVGDDVAVAFLAQTVVLDEAEVRVVPRRQPLKVRPATPLIAVTRIESNPRSAIELQAAQVTRLAARIAATAAHVSGIQIDFDARASERRFYGALLREVRSALGARTPMTITALASWCQSDDWLEGLPIDGAVPMLFRMEAGNRGPHAEPLLTAAACRGAVGTSLDEPLAFSRRGRRVYVFNPGRWTEETVTRARTLGTP